MEVSEVKVFVGSDHTGFGLKEKIIHHLAGNKSLPLEIEGIDLGTNDKNPIDYPKIAFLVAEKVAENNKAMGVLICGTGTGMSIAANKVNGVRATTCNEILTAEIARRHNDANILCLGARIVGPEVAKKIVEIFLTTGFDGNNSDGKRHKRRINQIKRYEMVMLRR